MKILRVVTDYWPHWGGNERWSLLHDRWFSEVAGDDVQVVVLRTAVPGEPAHRELVAHGLESPGPFSVPDLPGVRAYQTFFPDGRGGSLARSLHRLLRPWVESAADIVITQIHHYHAYFSWRGRPVVLEPTWQLGCTFGYRNPGCRRTSLMCRRCFRTGGLRWWVKDQLKMAMLRRFDLIVGNEAIIQDLARLDLGSNLYVLRHIVDPAAMDGAEPSPLARRQQAAVDELAARYPFVLLQFNRLSDFKNPQLLLDVAEQMPECAVAFAGDGLERPALEARVASTPGLRDRVVFLGFVPATSIGFVARRASAFVMTSVIGNYNTSLCETMGLGIAPVVVVGTPDLPPVLDEHALILKVAPDARALAAQLRQLLGDEGRRRAMVAAARRYVETYHSPAQMWLYRQRLQTLLGDHRPRTAPREPRPAPADTAG